jgi:hypothetical protein
MPTTTLQRPENRSQIHNRLVIANTVSSFCQQSGLNRSQIVKVDHLLGDRADQHLAKLKEKRYEGRIDLQTGKITPIITGMQGPPGALFVSTLPEVRLDQVGSSGALTGVFRVSRTGDVSQALQVFLNINDSSSADPSSSNTQKSVTIPIGASSATVAVALDWKIDFKEDGSKQVPLSVSSLTRTTRSNPSICKPGSRC